MKPLLAFLLKKISSGGGPEPSLQKLLSKATEWTAREEEEEREGEKEEATWIATSSQLMDHNRDFTKAETEHDSYTPWISMTNVALAMFKDLEFDGVKKPGSPDIICIRADPHILRYVQNDTTVERKPDTVIVDKATAQSLYVPVQAEPMRWREIAAAIASAEKSRRVILGATLDWIDVLSCCEHKQSRNKRNRVPSLPRRSNPPRANHAHSSGGGDTNSSSSLTGPFKSQLKGFSNDGQHIYGLGVLLPDQNRALPKRVREQGDSEDENVNYKSLKKEAISSPRQTTSSPSYSMSKASDSAQLPVPSKVQNDLSNPFNQAAEYAIARLGASQAMTHAIGSVRAGDSFSIQWYDRHGILSTRPINVHTTSGLQLYLAFLFILQRFDLADWGMHPAFPPLPDMDRTDPNHADLVESLKNRIVTVGGKTFRLEGVRRKQWGIKGRSTSVVDCVELVEDEWPPRSCVIKVSFPEETRRREHEFLDHARKIAEAKPEIRENIPDYLAYEEYKETSSSDIRASVGQSTVGSRHMYAIVLLRLDKPIRELSGKQYWDVWWDCFDCHFALWKGGLHHRDISDGNLMYRTNMNGKIVGVLSDFDLSSLEGDKGHNSERTGTLPFMARDLLQPAGLEGRLQHKYEHDAEAFFWVAFIDTALYPGKSIEDLVKGSSSFLFNV